MTATRRFTRRRLRLFRRRSQLPGTLWRTLAIAPMLLLGSLLGVHSSGAWFTSDQPVTGAFQSGNWASLMNPDTAPALSFTGFTWDGSRFRTSGLIWDAYSGTFSVTSEAGVRVNLYLEMDAGGPAVKYGNTLLTPTTAVPIDPGQSLTFTLSGSFSDWSGNLRIFLGSGQFDWITVPLTVEAAPRTIETFIEIKAPKLIFCDGIAAPHFEDVELMTIRSAPGMPPIPLQLALLQSNPYSPYPTPGPGPHINLIVDLLQPTTQTTGLPAVGSPPVGGTPTLSELFWSSGSAERVRVHQESTNQGNPTTLRVTLSSPSADVQGSVSYDFTLAHANSHVCLLHGSGDKRLLPSLTGEELDLAEQGLIEQATPALVEGEALEGTTPTLVEQGAPTPGAPAPSADSSASPDGVSQQGRSPPEQSAPTEGAPSPIPREEDG